jgi:hypothetical protein
MAWIRTIPRAEATGDLERADRVAARAGAGQGAGVAELQSLIPLAMEHAFEALVALTSAELPLTRREREMVTIVVSAANRCFT